MIFINENFTLKTITTRPGVYQMFDKQGVLVYVGKASNLRKRLSHYFSRVIKDSKTKSLVASIHAIELLVTRTPNEALVIENNLIKKHHPKYNIVFRDDKTYPYIYISEEDYPKIGLYRGLRSKKGLYFGPYPHSKSARYIIHLIQKLFRIRTCSRAFFSARTRPCLQYQIKRCSAPCVQYISQESYRKDIDRVIRFLEGKEVLHEFESNMELASKEKRYEDAAIYRDQIRILREIQSNQEVDTSLGNIDVVVALKHGLTICVGVFMVRNGQVLGNRTYRRTVTIEMTLGEILTAFLMQHYLTQNHIVPTEIILNEPLEDLKALENLLSEQANHALRLIYRPRGVKKTWVKMALNNAELALSKPDHSVNYLSIFESIEKITQFDKPIKKMVCFDISHTQGTATIGSCVVFDVKGPLKSDYRYFNITGIQKGDDVAAMRQVLMRYFSGLKSEQIPELVLVDGGKTQLAQAIQVLTGLQLQDQILILGVAKDPSRKAGLEKIYQAGNPNPLSLESHPEILNLFLRIRDEAHRFAITGHRKKRQKMMTQSILETIPKVGAKRRRDLLKHFGGLQGLLNASIDDIEAVSGIGAALAAQIYETLH